ncbi:MAG: hypothetical protein S4CHLAM6_08460 [Chlamydiae bacterium]|nr:hypothetical protein [Chlamydiota bacterium]
MASISSLKQPSDLEKALKESRATHTAHQKKLLASESDYKKAIEASLAGLEAVSPSSGGLPNIGNSCYLNSLIQAVFKHGSSYRSALEAKASAVIVETTSQQPSAIGRVQIQKTLQQRAKLLLTIIQLSEKKPTKDEPIQKIHETLSKALRIFVSQLANSYPQYASGQHDPGEAFFALTSYLDIEVDLPRVEIHTHLQTKSGEHSHFKADPEQSAMIVLASKESRSLQEAIDSQFMNPELMQGDCQLYTSTDETKKADGYKTDFPICCKDFADEIIIQAPRFDQKIIQSTSLFSREAGPAKVVREKRNAPINFEDKIVIPIFDINGACAVKKVTLELVSVIGHRSKSKDSGHYVSYVKAEDGNFILYNDSSKTTLSRAEAKKRIALEGYQAVYRKVKEEVVEREHLYDFGSLSSRVLNFKSPSIQMEEISIDTFEELPSLQQAPQEPSLMTSDETSLSTSSSELEDDFLPATALSPKSFKTISLIRSTPAVITTLVEEALKEAPLLPKTSRSMKGRARRRRHREIEF